MASIRNRRGKWEAAVCIAGVRKSSTHNLKREAVSWVAQITLELQSKKSGLAPDIPVSVLLGRYAREVSVTKAGCRWELIRLKMMGQAVFSGLLVSELRAGHLALWRDRRLSEVSEATVLREMKLLNNVFVVASRDWGYNFDNPLLGVRRPSDSLPRDRRITDVEIEAIKFSGCYSFDSSLNTKTSRVVAAFLFAIETGMRCSEICRMKWHDLKGVYVNLPKTKNGHPRNVPLSVEALRILEQLPKSKVIQSVFDLTPSSVDSLFRKIRGKACIEDLHFHDSRHEAITRLARKLEVLDLARMIGHRDLKQLMIYYNATPGEIAARLG